MLILIALILFFCVIFVWNMVSFNEGFEEPEPEEEEGEGEEDIAADEDLTSRIDDYTKKKK